MRISRPALLFCLSVLTACGEDSPSGTVESAQSERTPVLVSLAESGDLPALDALLSRGDPPDVLDSCRWTPLMKASLNGHFSTAKRLLDAGADPDAQDQGGYRALMLAASKGYGELTTLLLDHGAEIDHREETLGWTALIWASKEGHAGSVRALLERRADAELRDVDGRNASDWARENGHRQVLSILADGHRTTGTE